MIKKLPNYELFIEFGSFSDLLQKNHSKLALSPASVNRIYDLFLFLYAPGLNFEQPLKLGPKNLWETLKNFDYPKIKAKSSLQLILP